MNDEQYSIVLGDKLIFNEVFKDYLKRDFINLRKSTVEDFKEFLKNFKVKTFLTIGFILMFLNIFIPEPKTAYYMLAASVVTEENVKGVVDNTTDVITELVEGISDALDNDKEKE